MKNLFKEMKMIVLIITSVIWVVPFLLYHYKEIREEVM